jgi:hypothetical protein
MVVDEFCSSPFLVYFLFGQYKITEKKKKKKKKIRGPVFLHSLQKKTHVRFKKTR